MNDLIATMNDPVVFGYIMSSVFASIGMFVLVSIIKDKVSKRGKS